MRAFVTGATGFVGSHLVRTLRERGDSVVALVRDPRKARALPEGVILHRGDLTDRDTLETIEGPFDAIFHLGAAISGDWNLHNRVTVEGTRNLMRFAVECGLARLVLVSSLAVYEKTHLKRYDTINETSPTFRSLRDGGPYAWGKLEAERLVAEEASQRGVEYVIARPGLIYGEGHIVFAHLGPGAGRLRFPIGGSGVRLPLTHVDSVVDALIKMAEMPGLNGDIFNIVDDEQPTKSAYARALASAGGPRLRTVGISAAPFIAASRAVHRIKTGGGAKWLPAPSPEKIRSRSIECRYDCAALRSRVGWRPACSLEEGLARSLHPRPLRAPAAIERIGIIGAGRMADFHINAIKRLPGVRISAVLDTDLRAARAAAERHGIPIATDSADVFFAQGRPQSVHVLTPPRTHAGIALDAVERGCHVFLEKPMVLSTDEADALARAAGQRGVTVGVGHNYATDARIARARGLIASGAIGELVHIDLHWGFDIRRFAHALPGPDGAPTWAMQLPGALLEDILPHPLSIVFSLATEAMEPRAWHAFRSGRLEYTCDDEVRLLLAGRHATASLGISLTSKPDDLHLVIYGTRGTLKLDVNNMILIHSRLTGGPKAVARILALVTGHSAGLFQTARNILLTAARRADPPASIATIVREHYAALGAGRPIPVGLEDGRRAVEIARLLWPSVHAGLTDSGAALNEVPAPYAPRNSGRSGSTLVATPHEGDPTG
jgi:nucleoside-diphosphate-sugar epimerase/predicted dehydrogenase